MFWLLNLQEDNQTQVAFFLPRYLLWKRKIWVFLCYELSSLFTALWNEYFFSRILVVPCDYTYSFVILFSWNWRQFVLEVLKSNVKKKKWNYLVQALLGLQCEFWVAKNHLEWNRGNTTLKHYLQQSWRFSYMVVYTFQKLLLKEANHGVSS